MKKIIATMFLMMLIGCQPKKLPILGEPQTVVKMVDGKKTEVTEYPKIPDFSFTNHQNKSVTQQDMKGKIYVEI